MDGGKICATPLWNATTSWDSKDPYFSECFKHLILVVGSCAVLWIVAPLEFIQICKYHGTPSPWTRVSISKIICKILLLIVCIIELGKEIYAYVNHIKHGLDGILAATAYFVTIVLTVVMTMMCKRRGMRASLALPSFWMISTITTVITIYDDIHALDWNDLVSSISLVDDCAVFVISLIQIILSSISEKVPVQTGRQFVKKCPLDGRSLLSRLTFGWMLSLFAKSSANTLHQDYLIPQCHELRSASVSRMFNKIWKKNIGESMHFGSRGTFNQHSGLGGDIDSRYKPSMSLWNTLMKVSRKYIVISSIIEVLYTALYFLPTYLLKLILGCDKEEQWHKYLYATSLFGAMMLCTFADSQRKYYGLVSAMKMKTAVMNAVFEKALVAQKLQDVEKFLHEDSEKIFQMACMATEVWGAPLRLLIGFYLLWWFLGSASFIGIATAAFLIPLNTLLENLANYFQNKSVAPKEERLNVINEVLNGMKAIKMYAWEEFFIQKLLSLRKAEIKDLRKAVFIRICFKFFTLSSTLLVALATFTVYVLMNDSVDVEIIFIALYLIHLLKTPFSCLLYILAYFVEGIAAISRVRSFLEEAEVESFLTTHNDSEYSISLNNATFTWDKNEAPCLKNLNLKVRDSTLIAILGEAHSGKSSLLQALLGQMQTVDGSIGVNGSIAFVSKTPWIQNTTLEKNVLFSKPKVSLEYRKCLEACDLLHDTSILPEGDETQIGEMGYQLNEDQKLKVDLARAVYQNADIYLFDEPFRFAESAEHLYQRVVGRSGILKNKTRIFTTKDTTFLPLVDQVIFLKNGYIVEQGDYSELLEKDGYFSQYVKDLSKSTFKENRKKMSDRKSKLNDTDYLNDHCDPWYFSSGTFLKLTVESQFYYDTFEETKGFFRNLLKYLKVNGYGLMFVTVLAACVACFCEAASWIWWAKWNPEHMKNHKLSKHFYVYVGFILVQILCTGICGVLVFTGSTLAVGNIYKWLINRIMRASLSIFGSNFKDKIRQSLDKDLQAFDEKIPMVFFVWLLSAIKAPTMLLVIYFESPILCVFSIPLMVAYFAILKLYLNTWKQLRHLSTATRCPLTNLLKETLSGISNIRAYNSDVHYRTRFQIKLDTHNNCYFLFLLVSRWLSCSTEIIGSVFVFLTSLTIFIEQGHESKFVGLVIIFSMQVAEVLIALTCLSSLLDTDFTSMEQLISFSAIAEESEWENSSCVLPPSWPTSGLISIQNLSTSYSETLYPVLNNVNLIIQPNEKVAICGKEGSGVSTLLDSLCRIREIPPGHIFIDNIDISDIGLYNFRSRLAYIPQDPLVFSGNLRDNLDPQRKYEDKELWTAAVEANLNSYFTNLNQFIENDISPEHQHRISYARCVLKKSRIVLLDEPESSLQNGKMLFPNSTLLTFTESETLDNYDRVVRLVSGEIREIFPEPTTSYH